jgi:hypothetical protein
MFRLIGYVLERKMDAGLRTAHYIVLLAAKPEQTSR